MPEARVTTMVYREHRKMSGTLFEPIGTLPIPMVIDEACTVHIPCALVDLRPALAQPLEQKPQVRAVTLHRYRRNGQPLWYIKHDDARSFALIQAEPAFKKRRSRQ